MNQLKQIGFKNFRKFKDFQSIDLGPITILVGGNNAGKSTMVKALLLVVENLKRQSDLPLMIDAAFSFRSALNDLHIETFKRALYCNAEKQEIEFSISIGSISFEITVHAADDVVLFHRVQEEQEPTAPITKLVVKDSESGICITCYPFLNSYKIDFDGKMVESNEVENAEIKLSALNLERKHKKADILESDAPDEIALLKKELKDIEVQIKKYKEIVAKKKLDQRVELYDVSLNYYNEWRSLCQVSKEIKALAAINKNTMYFGNDAKSFNNNVEILMQHSFGLNKMANNVEALLTSIDLSYIHAHLASQKIMLDSNDDENMMAAIADRYVNSTAKFDKNGKIKESICEWMSNDYFEIGKDFRFTSYPGNQHVMEILTYDDNWINVADMGMGTNQLMILLFATANKICDWYRMKSQNGNGESNKPISTIIIEEPEQNLHPKLQSMLAQFVYDITTNFDSCIRFIIETHSEYLVRRSQVIVNTHFKGVEDKELENNPFKVYYFPSNKNPYMMIYRTDGKFSNKFDSGFFDENSKLIFNIL